MRLIIVIMTWLLLGSVFAAATSVDDISASIASNNVAKVKFSGEGLNERNVKIFEIRDENPRIVVDIAQATSDLLKKGIYRNTEIPGVKSIRGALSGGKKIRFVVDLVPGTKMFEKTIQGGHIIIQLTGNPELASQYRPEILPENAKTVLVIASVNNQVISDNVPIPRLKPKIGRKPVIVIDAGHGGRDPGAIGGTGLQEKHVTLSTALELKRQLLATGRYKVVMSRGNDRYIEHDDRLRVARENGADLFISLHADATDGKTARGVSVYTLADHAKKRSKRIVNSQNWIMDVNLSEQSDSVGDILVDLAQRNTFSKSTEFADILIGKLGISTQLLRNTHRRAGYYVLLAPDVPAVLLELGFISNPQDERLLKTDSHRQKLMRSVTSAINKYFDRQKS